MGMPRVEKISSYAEQLKSHLVVLNDEKDEIADCIYHSIPVDAYREIASRALDLVEACEENEQHGDLTHELRNALTRINIYSLLDM